VISLLAVGILLNISRDRQAGPQEGTGRGGRGGRGRSGHG